MSVHHVKTISLYDISEILGTDFTLAFTRSNVLGGFRFAGVWPLSPDIFNNDEYLTSCVTDRPQPENPVNEPENNDPSRASRRTLPSTPSSS